MKNHGEEYSELMINNFDKPTVVTRINLANVTKFSRYNNQFWELTVGSEHHCFKSSIPEENDRWFYTLNEIFDNKERSTVKNIANNQQILTTSLVYGYLNSFRF